MRKANLPICSLSLLVALVSSGCNRMHEPPKSLDDDCHSPLPRQEMCVDSGIAAWEKGSQSSNDPLEATCVERAAYNGYEIEPASRTADCAWVVCLDADANGTCSERAPFEVFQAWLRLSGDVAKPFGFINQHIKGYRTLCTPTRAIDGKCCFLLTVAESGCLSFG